MKATVFLFAWIALDRRKTMADPRCAECSRRSKHVTHTHGETGKLCLECWMRWQTTTDRWSTPGNGAETRGEAAGAALRSDAVNLMSEPHKRSDAL